MNEKIQPSFSRDRQVLGKALPLDTPFSLVIDASEACNFTCGYCFRSQKNRELWGYAAGQELMDWDTFVRIVEQAGEFPRKIKTVSLSHHGEPLCNRLLPRMADYVKKADICETVSIHTNASLLTPETAVELAESRIDKIVISIQGTDSEAYRETCGCALDFERFCENISLLYESKTNTGIYIKIVDAALRTEEEEKRFYEIFSPMCDHIYVEKAVPIWSGADIARESGFSNKFGMNIPPQQCCGLTFYTLVVLPGGDVYPCTQLLCPYVLGNVRSSALRECWEGEKRRRYLRAQLGSRQPECCRDCFIRQNSVFAVEDMIDDYREEILERL